MTMEELHEQRVHFVQRVQATVSEDLLKNGLELEAVSLTGLDQTQIEYLNPKNAFDAQGLTRLTETIEARRKQRNDIEQDTEVAISQKNLVAEQQKLEIEREKEYARLAQQREVEVRRAQQTAEIAEQRAAREREAKQAEISARQQVEQTEIAARQNVEEQRIESERRLREQDIARNRDLEAAEVQRRQVVSLTEQERAIVVAQKSKAQSEAQAEADKARAAAVQAEELVITTRERAKAERAKQIDLVRAAEDAETKAILVTVAAEAEKKAAEDKARAIATLAEAEANKTRLVASGEAEAEKLRAEGAERRYEVDAAGRRALHEADNLLSTDQIAMQVRLAIVRALPQIIAESVKPMERINGIKIMQLDGLTGGRAGGYTRDGDAPSPQPARGNLAEEVVSSALRYRAQAPIVDGLMKELGISGLSGPELGSSLIAATRPAGPTHDDGDDGDPGNAPGNGIAAGAFGA